MVKKHKTEAFVLKEKEMNEADIVFFVFSKDFGRLDLLAKSARKISSKLRPQMELFSLVRVWFVEGKKGERLVEAKCIERFSRIKKDLERIFLVQKISEILDSLIKGPEKEEKIFNLLQEVFEKLNSFSFRKKEELFWYFFWNLIWILGFLPNLKECDLCKSKVKGNCFFSFEKGAIICLNCKRKIKEKLFSLDFSVIKLIELILKENFNFLEKIKIPKKILKKCRDFSEKWLSYLLEKNEIE
jgi:DNA repair protein RecO (recombination protein O)